MSDEGVDWTGVTEEMAREIKQQGETFLQAQLQAAIASDQRATTMAGVCVTLATAVVAAGIAYWDKSSSIPILLGSFPGGLSLLIAAGYAGRSARPVDFYYPGNQPNKWYEIRGGDLTVALGGEAENYDQHIASNQTILADSREAINIAFWIAIASPVVGGAVWGAAEVIFSLSRLLTA